MKDKSYKKGDKHYKKSYDKAHIGQEWDSNDESSNSDSDGVATVAIKRTTSSSKSLFPKLNQGKHTYLMAKESKRKTYSSGGRSCVLDSGCTNHMTGEKEMFTSLKKMITQVTQSRLVTIVMKRYLGMVKSPSLPIILFLRFCLLNH
jgi:hypothetical protein